MSVEARAGTTHVAALVQLAREHPSAGAARFRHDGTWVAWDRSRLAREVARAAAGLEGAGLLRGQRVGLLAPTSIEWYVAALGIQFAGGVVVGLYPSAPVEQAREILRHAGCRILLADAARAGTLAGLREELVDLHTTVALGAGGGPSRPAPPGTVGWTDLVEAHAPGIDPLDDLERRARAVSPLEMCSIVYTSGTTGAPKGAVHTYETIGQITRSVAPALGYRPSDEYLSYLPMSHTAEQQNTLVLGSGLGWRVNFSSLDTIFADLPAVRPHVMFAVPRLLEKLRAELEQRSEGGLAELGLDRLRVLLAGGAPVHPGIVRSFASLGLQIRNGYGMTEASGIAMQWATPPRADTVGTPLPGVEVVLADDGEILVRSSGVCRGYLDDPESTANAFDANGFLRTGDLGKATADGELQIVGRKKDVLITAGGKNVAPAPIEALVARCPLVRRAVLVGNDRPYLAAVVELEPTACTGLDMTEITATVDAHVHEVNTTLSRPEQIKRFAIATRPLESVEGVLTPTMKLRREHFEAAYASHIDALYDAARDRPPEVGSP